MKSLNEEIGMSQEGIDYVNSLEVKEPDNLTNETLIKITPKGIEYIKNKIDEEQRIKRQGRNALICVLIIIAATFITNYFNK